MPRGTDVRQGVGPRRGREERGSAQGGEQAALVHKGEFALEFIGN